MPTPHKHAECIKAWADGKEVQYRYTTIKPLEWITPQNETTLDWSCKNVEWRIKPEKKEGWVNIYPSGYGRMHPTKVQADQAVSNEPDGRIACIKITYEEGEGL